MEWKKKSAPGILYGIIFFMAYSYGTTIYSVVQIVYCAERELVKLFAKKYQFRIDYNKKYGMS